MTDPVWAEATVQPTEFKTRANKGVLVKADLEGSPDQILEELERILRADPHMEEKQIREVLGQMKALLSEVFKEVGLEALEGLDTSPNEKTKRLKQAVNRLNELIGYDEAEEEDLSLEAEELREGKAKGIHELMALLTDEERTLLQLLANQGWEMDREALSRALPGVDVDSLIQVRINRKAIDSLQDVLIASGGGRRIVCDPYREALSEAFASVH